MGIQDSRISLYCFLSENKKTLNSIKKCYYIAYRKVENLQGEVQHNVLIQRPYQPYIGSYNHQRPYRYPLNRQITVRVSGGL